MYSLYITVRLVTRLWDGRSAVRILAELLSKPSKPALGQTQYPIHLLIGSTVDQRSGKWQSKNVTIFVGIIIYQLHVSALIGHLQVGIQRQRKISIVSIGMGGRDLVYKHMGLEVEPILPQTPYICKRDLSPHTYTYNRYFRLTLYPNLKMEYQGRNM